MCKSREEAEHAHVLCRGTLNQLGLEIHALEEPKSKSKIGYFSKDGLDFLGVRFEGQVTYPQGKVVLRFKQKIELLLTHSSSDNLLKTLQRLANLITGWGMGYRHMRVVKTYGELDGFIKDQVAQYLRRSEIHLMGRDRRKQMRFLGVPSLSRLVAHDR
jgi:hypothetical protein